MPPDKAAPKLSPRSRAADARRARGEEHTLVTATLRLTRHANGMVIELRRGQFEIELDGKSIGAILYLIRPATASPLRFPRPDHRWAVGVLHLEPVPRGP